MRDPFFTKFTRWVGEVNMHLFSCFSFSFSHKPLCFQGEAGKLSEEGGTSSIDRLPHRFALKISLHSQRYLWSLTPIHLLTFLHCLFVSPQRKLWSFWWELSHGTLTYQDLEWLVRSSKAHAEIRRGSYSLCKMWRLLLQLGPYNHIKNVVWWWAVYV